MRQLVVNLKKSHSKKPYLGKKYLFVNNLFFFNLFYKIEHVSLKNKRWLFRRLAKKRLVFNYRAIFSLSVGGDGCLLKNHKFDPLYKVFYKYNFSLLISLAYYKITDYHLELIRRLARKIFGKKIFLSLLIAATFNVLRRGNQVRMGGGKGSKFFKKVYFLYPGCPILEVRGISLKFLNFFQLKLKKKLPFLFKVLLLNRC